MLLFVFIFNQNRLVQDSPIYLKWAGDKHWTEILVIGSVFSIHLNVFKLR